MTNYFLVCYISTYNNQQKALVGPVSWKKRGKNTYYMIQNHNITCIITLSALIHIVFFLGGISKVLIAVCLCGRCGRGRQWGWGWAILLGRSRDAPQWDEINFVLFCFVISRLFDLLAALWRTRGIFFRSILYLSTNSRVVRQSTFPTVLSLVEIFAEEQEIPLW